MNQGRKPNLTFFRDDHGFEIDTIADWKHTFAIEIKSSSEPERKMSANTRKYLELRKDESVKSAVFYLGDVTMKINETLYVSWKDWGAFNDTTGSKNDTIAAIEEGRQIAVDPTVKGYRNISELRAALEDENT